MAGPRPAISVLTEDGRSGADPISWAATIKR